jgi:hypothetical protein
MPKNVLYTMWLQWSSTGLPPFFGTWDTSQPAGTPNHWTAPANASAISSVIDCRTLNNVSIQVTFTGTPTGTLNFQGSGDFVPNPNNISGGYPINVGTWTSLTPAPTSPSGSAITVLGNLTAVAFPFIRVNYVATSGSGTIVASATGGAQ